MWRNRKFDGKIEKQHPPQQKTVDQILQQLRHVHARLPCKHEKFGGVKRRRMPQELNWSKKIIFCELPYWSLLLLCHNLDVMHIEKKCV